MARKITVTVRDDNDNNFERDVELMVPTKFYRVLGQHDYDDCDEFDYCWDSLCDMIVNECRELPRSWYIDCINWH